VDEIVMKSGDRKAMKMTGMMMKMVRGQMEKSSFLNNMCEGVALVGEESVTVPAGDFKTYRFHNSKYDSDSGSLRRSRLPWSRRKVRTTTSP
jgi:hypothetical protein